MSTIFGGIRCENTYRTTKHYVKQVILVKKILTIPCYLLSQAQRKDTSLKGEKND
jgi:hypothetical protein